MRQFDYAKLKDQLWDTEVVNYLSQIHEAKGKQTLYLRQKPEQLDRLVEIAKIQSTEASNEIEGIRTTETRLRQLMREKAAPRNRDESEIAGYRDALNVVHESFEYIPLTPNYILQLHKIMLSHTDSAFGGSFKNVQNYISATNADGKAYTLFTPLAPYETPPAVQEICDAYNRAMGEGKVDPLILISVFIHDFLCIHPFLDGNGRVGRLMILLYLMEQKLLSYPVIYISYFLKKNRVEYYDRMTEVRAKGNYEQWVTFFLRALLESAEDATTTIDKLIALHDKNAAVISGMGRAAKNAMLVFEYLEANPIIEIRKTAEALSITFNTASSAIKRLTDAGILVQTTNASRNRTFAYEDYLSILRKGT